MDILRKNVYERLELDIEKEKIKKRLGYLASHDQNLQRYMAERDEYLKERSEDELEGLIDAELNNIFK